MAISRAVREHLKPLIGLGFVGVLVVGVWGAWLSYSQRLPWQESIDVTLATRSAGLGLTPPADVKLQGLYVGQVRDVRSDGEHAVLRLALDPKHAGLIPRNVDAAIIPKTLFGERFVDLRLPERPSAQPIAAGDEIGQSQTSVEVSELFANVGSLLETLKPEQLSVTLTAMADALDGQGATLGESIDLLHRYLRRFNPHLDTLTHDLRQTARTADLYHASTDELVRVLDNSRAISRGLLVAKERSFRAFLDETIGTADATAGFLEDNGRQLVTLAGKQRPVLELLAEYSRGLPCLFDTLAKLDRDLNRVLGGKGPYAKVSIDLFVDKRTYTYPHDLPTNPRSDANPRNLPSGVPSWAPHCPVVPKRFQELDPVPPYFATGAKGATVPPARSSSAPTTRRLAGVLAGRLLNRRADEVPPLAALMLSPMLRGEVRLP
jgi:phospholipid/cholesterol/gamma-HCH transport system substrate-binding protein